MRAKGLLLVLVDPAASIEEELNDWYDTEHLPERAAIAGFETALRFTSLGDGPRYAAIYDLASLDVLDGEAYRAVSGENFSPWTRRVTSRSRPKRLTARRAGSADGVTGSCSRLLLIKFRQAADESLAAIEAGLDASFASDPGFLQGRVFAGMEPEPGFALAIAEFSGDRVPSLRTDAFGVYGRRIELAATYRPYRG